jgi:cobalt/nickel transport system permease protein
MDPPHPPPLPPRFHTTSLPMHIPDGFLDAKTLTASSILALAGVSYSVYQTTHHLPRRRIPLMGLSAAFIFAAQMLNFPVAGGTSGHLIGGTLAAILLGPSCAVLVLTSVLIVQCFLFADGGAFAIGANVLNMAIVDAFAGYAIYSVLRRAWPGATGRLIAAALGAWSGTVIAAGVCAGELAFTGRVSPGAVFPVMIGIHSLIGLGEAAITALVVATITRSRPELLSPSSQPAFPAVREFLAYGLIVCAALALFISPFASKLPDGLDYAAAKLGFSSRGTPSPVRAIAPDYKIPHIHSAPISAAIAAILGTIIVFILAIAIARILSSRSSTSK